MAHEATWQIQDAKNRLSELVRRVRENEPQVITVHGKEVAAIIPIDEYRRHHPKKRSDKTLLEVLRGFPRLSDVLSDDEIDTLFQRDTDTGRDIEFE